MTELQDLHDDGMWMQMEEMGERPDLLVDPFLDDTPLECGLENPDFCESCQ